MLETLVSQDKQTVWESVVGSAVKRATCQGFLLRVSTELLSAARPLTSEEDFTFFLSTWPADTSGRVSMQCCFTPVWDYILLQKSNFQATQPSSQWCLWLFPSWMRSFALNKKRPRGSVWKAEVSTSKPQKMILQLLKPEGAGILHLLKYCTTTRYMFVFIFTISFLDPNIPVPSHVLVYVNVSLLMSSIILCI